MTMADPLPVEQTLTLNLELTRANDADELTCLFCWGPKVEWEAMLRLDGRILGVGIHESCRARLDRPR